MGTVVKENTMTTTSLPSRELLLDAGFGHVCIDTILGEGRGHHAVVYPHYIESRLRTYLDYSFESVATPCAGLRNLSILHLPFGCQCSFYGLGLLEDASLLELARKQAEEAASWAEFDEEEGEGEEEDEEEEEEFDEEERKEPTVESLLEDLSSAKAGLKGKMEREPKTVPGGLLSALYAKALQSPEGNIGYVVARELEAMAARAIPLSAEVLGSLREVFDTIRQRELDRAEWSVKRLEEELQAVREGRWKEWDKAREEELERAEMSEVLRREGKEEMVVGTVKEWYEMFKFREEHNKFLVGLLEGLNSGWEEYQGYEGLLPELRESLSKEKEPWESMELEALIQLVEDFFKGWVDRKVEELEFEVEEESEA